MSDISKIKIGSTVYNIQDSVAEHYICAYSTDGLQQTNKWAYIKGTNGRVICFIKFKYTFTNIVTINTYSKGSDYHNTNINYPVEFDKSPVISAEIISGNRNSNENIILMESITPKIKSPNAYIVRNYLADDSTTSTVGYCIYVDGGEKQA